MVIHNYDKLDDITETLFNHLQTIINNNYNIGRM